jgi:Zn2+/Cd2+-exporting ATPase
MNTSHTQPIESNDDICTNCSKNTTFDKTLSHKSSFSITGFINHLIQQTETRLGIIGAFLFSISLVLKYFSLTPVLIFPLQIAGLFVAGYPLARSGLITLVKQHEFDINLLMTIAALGAIIIGDMEEGVSLILLFILAEALEGYTTEGARGVLGELSELVPNQAVRLKGNTEEIVSVENLSSGDILLIKPGDRIPMDGEVIKGTSEVNQAPITGESIPVLKEWGAPLYAGTINGSGLLQMTVSGSTADNTISRIIQLIVEAQKMRSPRQRMIDSFARVYTPLMAAAGVLVAIIPPIFFGQPFFNPPDGSHGWLYRALAFLVISCPCALVLSTPVAALTGITRAARQGVLFKGGIHLENLATIKTFAFDKTGTLTCGEPTVTLTRSVSCVCEGADSCTSCDDVLAAASSLERRSTHPLARAVVNEAEARGLIDQYPPAEDVVVSAGRGITGKINGKPVVLGSHAHFDDQYSHSQALCAEVEQVEANGQTTMMLYHEDQVSGYIAVADQPRSESSFVINQLKEMGKTTIMLTGDNKTTARSIGQHIGIELVHSNMLPDQKAAFIEDAKNQYGKVAMVGDGINDAPAIASATLGIAMGGAASAQAMETASIVLMAANLNQLPFSIRLSAFCRKIIQQNLSASLVVKTAFVVFALLGIAPLWLAVVADSGMALLVVINSLRPLNFMKQSEILQEY